jgi:Flp pilus assembly protein TadB
MTSKARAAARALREAESAKRRREAQRRARRRALLHAPWNAVKALVPRRRGRTGRLPSRRDRAQLAAVVMGLLVLLVVIFITVQSWALRVGAVVLALLLAPVLLTLFPSHRRVH